MHPIASQTKNLKLRLRLFLPISIFDPVSRLLVHSSPTTSTHIIFYICSYLWCTAKYLACAAWSSTINVNRFSQLNCTVWDALNLKPDAIEAREWYKLSKEKQSKFGPDAIDKLDFRLTEIGTHSTVSFSNIYKWLENNNILKNRTKFRKCWGTVF